MIADSLHPELRKGVSRIPRLPFAVRPLLPLTRAIFDLAAKQKALPGASRHSERQGALDLDVWRPGGESSGSAILWVHGGGHVAGKPSSLAETVSRVSRDLGATVVVPRYRLAPEHPFPADLEDCAAAWQWLVRSSKQLDVDPERIAIAGNSAGGGIAAALAQMLRDQGGLQPRAQVLFYPMLDDRTAAREDLDALRHFVWTNRANRVAWTAYLAPHEPGADELPEYAAPARAGSLAGLPPTWLGVGKIDLFHAEGVEYASRLERSGVPCELLEVDGAPHAFEVLVPEADVSRRFFDSAIRFLRNRLAAA